MNVRLKNTLISYIRNVISETKKAKISTEYQKKENIRQLVQNIIQDEIDNKQVTSQKDLDDLHKDISLALTALRSVPYEVWEKMSLMKRM